MSNDTGSSSPSTKTVSTFSTVDSGAGGGGGGGAAVFDHASVAQHKAPGLIGIVGAVAAAASLVAAAAIRRRRVAQKATQHPLKGSVQRRINLFAMLAKQQKGARRANNNNDDYRVAPEDGLV